MSLKGNDALAPKHSPIQARLVERKSKTTPHQVCKLHIMHWCTVPPSTSASASARPSRANHARLPCAKATRPLSTPMPLPCPVHGTHTRIPPPPPAGNPPLSTPSPPTHPASPLAPCPTHGPLRCTPTQFLTPPASAAACWAPPTPSAPAARPTPAAHCPPPSRRAPRPP